MLNEAKELVLTLQWFIKFGQEYKRMARFVNKEPFGSRAEAGNDEAASSRKDLRLETARCWPGAVSYSVA